MSKLIASSGAKSASEALVVEILHNLRYQHGWSDLRLHVVRLKNGLPIDKYDGRVAPMLVDLESDSYFSPNYIQQQQQDRSRSPSPSRPSLAPNDPPSNNAGTNAVIRLISGLPPRHSYIHPDLQLFLVKHSIPETSLPVQREFVLPLSTAEKWTMSRFCAVIDALGMRESIVVDAVATAIAAAGPAETVVSGAPNGGGSANRPTSAPANRVTATAPYVHKDEKRILLGMRAREGGGGDATVVYYIMHDSEVKPRQNG